ncbi:PepSY domain-containing protein [Sphingobium sp. BYY-5]|uniref:PepSY-associated TM helix domain-containing protein n=1 Tax=Sphingobium sp. BYY-5 TaxID=2926400 RepID=UPI001FA7E0B3|nr:PepSY-associated TM helix domain-containing protein [Sphingobium sp. BYY-5]MCI4591746.1 PepSY domain-containing protein [Sphingobium sp. BYY-5]
MSAVRDGVRQCMAWLHGWTGLLLGHILFIMCLTGTLTVFKPEIGRWMRPETVATASPADAILAATRWLEHNTQGSTGWYLTAPDGRANTVEASYDGRGAYRTQALDPLTGAPVARETLGGEFFYRLHFELELPYPWGRLIASLAAMMMLVALVTGVIAHKRIFKDIFTFRPSKGQRSWLDGHNALGVLAIPFHIMITFTGLLTLASLNLPWGMVSAYGEDMATLYSDLTPGSVTRPATGEKAPLAPIAPMLAQAQRYFGSTPISRVYVFNPGNKAAVVAVYPSDADAIGFMPREISFDGATGKPLKTWIEARPGIRTYQTVYGLHMARFAPSLTRWLYFLGGTMLTLTIATGMILWVVKRRERAPLSIGNRILERLNVGVLTGVPIGAVAFLLANRLLPLGLAARAEAEVSTALWSTGAAVLVGLALPPAIGWPTLLGALAITCLSAALLGPIWASGVLMATINLLLLGMALALLPIILRQLQRKRAPAPARRRAVPA